jgi:MFS family permease
MENQGKIDQYDLVEIIQVPQEYDGLIEKGDTGVVVEKYDEETFGIECLQPGGSSKWLESLNVKYLRLKSKDPYSAWITSSLGSRSMMRSSVIWGALIGAGVGALTTGALGAITKSLNGILIGLVIGIVLGGITGALTAALTVKTAGTTGGVGVGYYTGMLFGGFLGLLIGVLIPTSWRVSAHTEGLPVLDALAMGRFETAAMLGFLLSILATIVGVWIGGRNSVPRNLREE